MTPARIEQIAMECGAYVNELGTLVILGDSLTAFALAIRNEALEEVSEIARAVKLRRSGILHERRKTELATQAFDTALEIDAAIRRLKETT